MDNTYRDIPVRRINLNWQKSPDPQKYLYNNPAVATFLEDDLNEIKPDVVHVTSCETLSASVLDVVKKANIPLVMSITDFWFLCPRINLLTSQGENCEWHHKSLGLFKLYVGRCQALSLAPTGVT